MHQLFIGRTRCGKSSLAKEITSELRLAGAEVLAFNPLGERGWTRRDEFGRAGAEWETDDPEAYVEEVLERVRRRPSRVRFLAIDEAHDFFPRAGCTDRWLATQGRHYGLNLLLITQRAAIIDTTVRTQCLPIHVFQCSLTDAQLLADEFGKPELKEAPTFQKGEFVKVDDNGLTRHKLF